MTYRVSKIQLLDYAIEGAKTLRGVYAGQLTEEEIEDFDADIDELEWRLQMAETGVTVRKPKEPK